MTIPEGYRTRSVVALQCIETGECMKPAEYVRVYLGDWRQKHPRAHWPSGPRVQSAVRMLYGVEVSVRWVYAIIREMDGGR